MSKAIAQFQKAIQINPKYATAYNNLGIAYSDQGEWSKAIKQYQKAIQINPKYVTAYYNLGNAYKAQGEWSQAIAQYQKAIEINPKDATAYNSLGWTYLELFDLEKALSYLEQSWEVSNQQHSHAAMNLGHVFLFQEQIQKAMEWYRKSIPLWKDVEVFFGGMESDYVDLKMKERGIEKVVYEGILKELREGV